MVHEHPELVILVYQFLVNGLPKTACKNKLVTSYFLFLMKQTLTIFDSEHSDFAVENH